VHTIWKDFGYAVVILLAACIHSPRMLEAAEQMEQAHGRALLHDHAASQTDDLIYCYHIP
jgi:hypothetical protein